MPWHLSGAQPKVAKKKWRFCSFAALLGSQMANRPSAALRPRAAEKTKILSRKARSGVTGYLL